MSGKDQHVVPHGDKWGVRSEGASRLGSVHDTQREAIDTARGRAQREKSEMFVHGRDGRIRDRSTYGNDPYPPKG
jgi:hypothetical protein